MEEQRPRLRFDSFTFFIGFGIGSFIGVALALLAIALVQRSDASDPQQTILIPTFPAPPPGTTATPDARPRTKTAQNIHLGPGEAFAVIGTIARDEAVEVVGRSADSSWVAVRFPPGSAARGWLPVSEITGLTSLDRLAVVLPTPLPRNVTVPVFSTSDGDGSSNGPPQTTTTDPRFLLTPTPRANIGPVDLVVNRVTLLTDGRVRVVVGNRGPGDLLQQQVNVLVRDSGVRNELMISSQRGLAVGETITLTSEFYVVQTETEVTVIADPSGNVNDPDISNNSMRVTLSPPPPPTPTATPRGSRGDND
jgi:hypothetical protein